MSTFFWISTSSTDPTVGGNWQKDDGTTGAAPDAAADVVVKTIPGITLAAIGAANSAGTAWTSLTIDPSYTSTVGNTATNTASFYGYWKINATNINIDGTNSGRIKINAYNTASIINVAGSGTTVDIGYDPVRLVTANVNTVVNVLSGQVGIATNLPGETSTVGTVSASGANATVNIGPGTTWTAVGASGGAVVALSVGAATGTLTVGAASTATVVGTTKVGTIYNGGTCYLNQRPASGNMVTTLYAYNGSVTDYSGNPSVGVVNARVVYPGCKFVYFSGNTAHITTTGTTYAGNVASESFD